MKRIAMVIAVGYRNHLDNQGRECGGGCHRDH